MQTLIGFLFLAVPAYFTPGPNNLMLFASVMRFGARRTLPHALGIIFGFPLMVLGVGLGVGAVFLAFPQLKTVLQYLAAAYFLWMAWHLLGFKVESAEGRARPLTTLEAALFQWINPKAWAMAISFAGAFVVPGDGRFWSVGLLTLGCLAVAPWSCAFWMFFGGQLQQFLVRTHGERFLGPILAALMVIAVVLFLV